MPSSKTNLLTNKGLTNNVLTTGIWTTRFGGSISAFFKPFSTATGILNYGGSFPRYNAPVIHPNNVWQSGFASSSGLNPFGPNTLCEGHLYGTSVPNTPNFDTSIDSSNVRTHGIKTPVTYVGWGYDTFGYPAPNASSGYSISGVLGTISPSIFFASGSSSGGRLGSDVPEQNWLAGPLDLRWDCIRKVWTANSNGIFAAYVIATYASGIGGASNYVSITAQGYRDSGFYPHELRYDAITFDGCASTIKITGVRPIGPQIGAWQAKVKPLMPGYPVQIQQYLKQGNPAYGLWAKEPDYWTDCNGVAYLIGN